MVELLESTFVVPSEETPRETLVLSNLDLVAIHKHNCSIYLYKNTEGTKDFMCAEVLKSALAKALVLLYPLTGRHVVGQDGRDQIDCNAKGILFQVAQLDRTSDSIEFEPMSRELRELFIPKEELSSSLIQMLQVTYLKCGSVVLGSSNNHIIIDGRSASYLYQTWSRIAREDLKSIVPPSFDNTPIRPRSPPKISFDFPEYTTKPQIKRDDLNSCVLSLLRVSKEQISDLKNRCCQGGNATSVSTFSAVSALIWKCYCIAKGLTPDSKSRFILTADVRSRLNPPLKAYFGNAMMRISAASEVSNITSNPIGDVAKTVKAIANGLTDEYIRSFIDYVEVNWNKKLYLRETSESDIRIRTILGMQFSDVDFGWGAPQLLSWERYTENRVIYLMNDTSNDGGVKVVPALDSTTMEKFKKVFYEELLFCQHETQ
ncbi:shikimate O-hydroxycinnamoyltransferase-like protein [Carex littledalei]|uniref:Shikimate O-hydroxycinnamoyltransferase-like protein n=1 Tax=Carex littledalei TaxID=544730 RepID=A0A833VRS3_9POAL|nr:shikimate O-hydroxycinnamoyltransferase-like protein [Carex littledalei]